jgi:glycopeptide antibiotics resistance protein
MFTYKKFRRKVSMFTYKKFRRNVSMFNLVSFQSIQESIHR